MRAFIAAVATGAMGASYFHTSKGSSLAACATASGGAPGAFSQSEFQSYKLVEVRQETHNVKHFKFATSDPKLPLTLPLASCITLKYKDSDGKDVVRPYTPLDMVDNKGSFELAIKCYPNSKMGTHLVGLKVGDSIDAQGPWASFAIAPSQFYHVGMLAGGTGITPLYQVARNILAAKSNTTKFSLIYANTEQSDILIGKEVEKLAEDHPNNFSVMYCLSKPPARWTGYKGYITKAMITECMPDPKRKGDSVVLVCGPPAFMKAMSGAKDYSSYPPKQGALEGYLKELGYAECAVYKF